MHETLQLSHQTKRNRFPKIFESAKNLMPNAKRILSFGCSTGEEAFTLAEIFPNSEIVGVDIDYHSIVSARRYNKFAERVFFHDCLGATGKYDVVTCLMVLFSLESPIPWARFEKTVRDIDQHINVGGLAMFYTCEYDLARVPTIRDNYETISSWTRTHDKNRKDYHCGYYKKKVTLPLVKCQ